MADLATTLKLMNLQKDPKVLKCFKTCNDLNISASASEEFFLVRVPVSRLSLSASSKKSGDAVIIDKNDLKVGRTAAGYLPKVYIVKGHNLVMQAMAEEQEFINVWAGTQAIKKLSIMADDSISSNELQQKLSLLIQKNYRSKMVGNDPCCSPSGPWIREVYPFENYVIFDWNGDTWKQPFVVEPVMRNVALSGKPVKVYSEYSETPKGLSTTEGKKAEAIEQIIESSAAIPVAPSAVANRYFITTFSQEQDFDPINSSDKPLGMVPGTGTFAEFTTYGAPSSEYANPPIKTMMNIEEAVRMYLSAIADGTHVPLPSPVFNNTVAAARYPNEYKECLIAAKEANANINIPDFMNWQNKRLLASVKTKNDLSAASFAYVGDPQDPSTWHCQCNTPKAIKASLAELKSSTFVPKSERRIVAERLLVEAKKFSTKERSKLADKGIAEPDGSYPIRNKKDLGNALKDINRSSDKTSADTAHIRKRAKALGVKDPFKKKSVKADGATNQLPGGYRPPPSVHADAEIAQQMVAKKKKKLKATDMPMPMPGPGAPMNAKKKKMSAGGPGSGRHADADAAEKASTAEEHLKAAKYHGERAQYYSQQEGEAAQDMAFAHMKAQTTHEDAARMGTARHTQWAQHASGIANATEEELDKSNNKKVAASFQPDAGRKKFKVGDAVVTKHGKGTVQSIDSKDAITIKHISTGKTHTLHHSEVKRAK